MTELSLSAINARAPYRLRKSELGGFDFDVDVIEIFTRMSLGILTL